MPVHKKEALLIKAQEVVSKKDTLVNVTVNQVVLGDTTQKLVVLSKKDSIKHEEGKQEVLATIPTKVAPRVMEEEVVTSVAIAAPKQEQIVVEGACCIWRARDELVKAI